MPFYDFGLVSLSISIAIVAYSFVCHSSFSLSLCTLCRPLRFSLWRSSDCLPFQFSTAPIVFGTHVLVCARIDSMAHSELNFEPVSHRIEMCKTFIKMKLPTFFLLCQTTFPMFMCGSKCVFLFIAFSNLCFSSRQRSTVLIQRQMNFCYFPWNKPINGVHVLISWPRRHAIHGSVQMCPCLDCRH